MTQLCLNSRLLCLCALLSVVNINYGKYNSKKAYSYQYLHRQYIYVPDHNDKENKWLCLAMGICAVSGTWGSAISNSGGIQPVYQWSQLEFDYPTPEDRQRDVASGRFLPGHPVPIDTDVYYGGNNMVKIFITIPRFQSGVPVTLGTVTQKTYSGNPVIAPFPDWRWHQNPRACNYERMVSVYRTQIDDCGRLWVLDTGRLEDTIICLPQILAFDLQTNQLVHKYEIPYNQVDADSILVTPVVDVRDPQTCRDTFVYVADCRAFSIIVHDVRRGNSWRIIDKTFYPYPNYGTYDIAGQQFELMDGVLGMSLSPLRAGEDRRLFYHALTSPTENWVHTSDIRDYTRYINDSGSSAQSFHTYLGIRPSQSAAEAIDQNGVQYFGLAHETSINCWNTATDYNGDNIDTLAQNPETMQFTSGVKVIKNKRSSEELWFMTMRFQRVATGTIDPSDVNFRIHAGKIDDILPNTRCQPRSAGYQHQHHNHNHNHNHNSGNGNRPHGPSAAYHHGGGYGYSKGHYKRDIQDIVFPQT